MKKYTVLFAALAVIALAGCKKEENKVNGILVGGENFVSMDKQGYAPDFGYVMFDGTDAFLFNGVEYGYTMVDNPTDMNEMTSGYSNYAILNVPGDAVVDDVTLLYPSNVFPINITETGMMMVSQADNAGDPNAVDACVWPMGYHNGNFGSHGTIQLKNAIALIAPAVKYGAPCFQNLFANNPAFANMTFDVNNAPTMTVTHVELVADTKLTGAAEIVFDADDMPTMVMTDPMDGATDALAMDAPELGVVIPCSGSAINIVGNMPVPPALNGANLTINLYFTLDCGDTSFDCVYTGEVIANVARNGRTTYVANMYAANNWNKITVL
ncbi:MAG: hypothetical protein IKH97_06915 [Bacteroidales bacterium]|nr:hypothetical protein [Bacteroidales bacterium]